jgi:hypothetical protein
MERCCWISIYDLAIRKTAPPIPTLGQLNRYEPHWVWWHCVGCQRWIAVPLAPSIIRWGRIKRSAPKESTLSRLR